MLSAMKRIALLLVVIVLTSLCFWPMTATLAEGGNSSVTEVLGMPVLGVASERLCWLSLGTGYGVLFVGLVGAGVVAITVAAGAGLLFGIGQAAAGMMVVGQLGLGLTFALAQLGIGATGYGQLIAGILVRGQLGIGKDGAAFLKQLDKDLDGLLSFR